MRRLSPACMLAFALACTPDPNDQSSTEVSNTEASETEDSGSEESGDEEPDYSVELLERACPFTPPSGRSAECYTLVAPLDRSQPEAGTVELPVAVLHPPGEATRAPTVYLHGGPGGNVFNRADRFFNRALSDDGIVVALDQRGAGLSLPSLDCPELEAGWYTSFSTVASPAEEIDTLRSAYADCHARLFAETELSAFNSSASADDLDDLRAALGYERWNVYGISYGTRLGLELMRRHGEHIERALLDSVYPPQVGDTQWMIDSASGALERVIAGCADEILCSATFPNLAANLDTAIANLDAEPYLLEVQDPQGQTVELQLTGADFFAGMFNALYDDELIPVVPLLIFQASQGNYGFLEDLADQSIPFLTATAEGARLSVDCVDTGASFDPTAVEDAIGEYPRFTTLFGAYAPPFCALWQVEPAPGSFLEPVESEIPTMLLAGEYDPVTPVGDTLLAAEGLPLSQTYVFPGGGHGVSFANQCAEDMTAQFLREGVVDDSCLAAISTDTF